jgi:hypothetical protein
VGINPNLTIRIETDRNRFRKLRFPGDCEHFSPTHPNFDGHKPVLNPGVANG